MARVGRQLTGLGVILSSLALPAAIVTDAVCLGLAIYVNPLFCLAILVLVPLQWAIWTWRKRSRASRLRSEIRKKWLQTDDEDHDLEYLCEEYGAWGGDNCDNRIDDWTWRDLDLDALCARIDRTFTTLGELSLYAMLRTPEVNGSVLAGRARVIHWLQENDTPREDIQVELLRLGKTRRFRIEDLWSDLLEIRKPVRTAARILSTCAALSIVLLLVLQAPLALMATSCLLAVNFVLTSWFRWLVYWHTGGVLYASAAIAAAARIGRLQGAAANEFTARLAVLAKALSSVSQKARFIERFDRASTELADLVQDYARGLFLLDILDYFELIRRVRAYRTELTELLTRLGELDALQSVASFRIRLGVYCEPALSPQDGRLELSGFHHPLIPESVGNSFALCDRSAFITGSNTSGKSTFLRAIGLNAVMAQTLYTVCATSYSGPFLRIMSSIENMDSLLESKSLYQAEAERLLQIIREADKAGATPLLCLLDEPLKGTNTQESISAGIEVLNYLAKRPVQIVVASHHVQVARELDAYDVYHFPDPLPENPQKRNYCITPGLNYERNGIKLLAQLGFPPEIVQAALERA